MVEGRGHPAAMHAALDRPVRRNIELKHRLSDKVDTETYKSIQPSGMRGSAPDQTDVRLRSDEPKADQRQHAGQDGEQEAIGNAGRQVATD